jgi:DNA-binding response OmpR family regulator
MATILLIDAVEGDAAVLASALRVEGFDVVVVPTATAARTVLADGMVALAVVDLMLRTEGEKHGLELARELRHDYPAMRVLLTSAYHLSERQLERADCGVSGFIPKPYDVAEVVTFIAAKVSGPPSSRNLWHAEPRSGVVGGGSGFKRDAAPPRTLTTVVDVDAVPAARIRR